MIKFGQFVKLNHDTEVVVSASWSRIVENYKTAYREVSEDNTWASRFVLPKGTVGLLKMIVVNQRHDFASVAIPDPVTKRITNVTLSLKTEDFTFDVSDPEKKPFLLAQRKFIAKKISDGFKAVDLIEHAKNYTE